MKMVINHLARGEQSLDRGAVAGEYAVLLAILSVALVTALGLFTDALIRAFDAAVAVLP